MNWEPLSLPFRHPLERMREGGVAAYLPKNNRGFAEKLFLSY